MLHSNSLDSFTAIKNDINLDIFGANKSETTLIVTAHLRVVSTCCEASPVGEIGCTT